MNAIELKGAVKQFPAAKIGPIDLTIRQGEFFGIFGPPSTGKSSLLRMILGLLAPDEGRVLLGGQDAGEVGVADRNVGMVFQNLALFPHMTGRQNIAFTMVERGAPKSLIETRLKAVSDVLRVGHLLDKHPAQMSGGERQRIALGRALAPDSRAILLDEPIAALDARLREEMRVELKRIQRDHKQTFVYVSHDEEEVMAVSDRLAVLIDGQIAQIGTPDDIYNKPDTIAVATLIGMPPMNTFQGRISADGQTFESDVLTAPVRLPATTTPGAVVTLGVRPEDIHLADAGAGAQDIAISSVEPLGGYTIVNATIGGRLLKIRAHGRVTRTEDYGTRITFSAKKLHLFDSAGRRM